MAIFATKNFSSNPPFILDSPEEGDLLIYDEKNKVFINKKINYNNYNFVSSAKNIQGPNSKNIFKEKTHDGTLIFKGLQAGPGISIQENTNNLIITAINSADVIISEDDYTIIIDADGNNSSASFFLKTVVPASTITIPINVLPPLTVYDLYTGNTTTNGYIESSSVNFFSYGFQKNMLISLEGSPDQDGIYLIDNVTVSGSISKITFVGQFSGPASFNLGGPKLPTTIKQASLWIPDNDGSLGSGYDNSLLYSVQAWGVNFGVGGYNLEEDMIINITGTENGIIDGTYRIKKVFVSGNNPILQWSSIIFHESTPLPVGLVPGVIFDNNLIANELVFTVDTHVKNTGFSVNKEGIVNATSVIVSAPTTLNNQLARKDYVDAQINLKINEFYDVVVSGMNTIINILEAEVDKIKENNKKTLRYYLLHARF
ncbi:MAG: hypothetical protein QXG00_05790 [Candidatus Woesearchaeota archaeon]